MEEIKDYTKDRLLEMAEYGDSAIYGCDLHNELFNTEYYIIGTYQAKQWLENYGTFDAIDKVLQYEKDNFGEVTTDISDPERLVNMLVYIIGEEILMESETLSDNWDNLLTVKQLKKIAKEIS